MTDTDTDVGPTRFPTAPWDHSSEGLGSVVDGEAAVWDSIGDFVCAVDSQMASNGEIESAEDRARLIAAAGRAAHDLPDEYDAVETIGILSELVQHAEDLMPLLEIQSSIDHTTLQDLLQKARRDDE